MTNNGLPIKLDLSNRSEQEIEALSEKFSEGSKAFKDLLKYLWANGLETFAGCTAAQSTHENRGFQQAYCDLNITEDNREKIINIINAVSSDDLKMLGMSIRQVKGHTGDSDNRVLSFSYAGKRQGDTLPDNVSDAFFHKVQDVCVKSIEKQKARQFVGGAGIVGVVGGAKSSVSVGKLFADTVNGLFDRDFSSRFGLTYRENKLLFNVADMKEYALIPSSTSFEKLYTMIDSRRAQQSEFNRNNNTEALQEKA